MKFIRENWFMVFFMLFSLISGLWLLGLGFSTGFGGNIGAAVFQQLALAAIGIWYLFGEYESERK